MTIKEAKRADKLVQKYNLNSLSPNDAAAVKQIANSLAGLDFIKSGMSLSFMSGKEQAKVGYLSAIVEQNWLIINLLSRISSQLGPQHRP